MVKCNANTIKFLTIDNILYLQRIGNPRERKLDPDLVVAPCV